MNRVPNKDDLPLVELAQSLHEINKTPHYQNGLDWKITLSVWISNHNRSENTAYVVGIDFCSVDNFLVTSASLKVDSTTEEIDDLSSF